MSDSSMHGLMWIDATQGWLLCCWGQNKVLQCLPKVHEFLCIFSSVRKVQVFENKTEQ